MTDSVSTDSLTQKLLWPERVAVVGASRDARKVGSRVLRRLAEGGYPGELIAVNPTLESSSFGERLCPSLGVLEENVDAAVLGVPKDRVLSAIQDGLDKVSNFIVLASGFDEVDPNDELALQFRAIHREGTGILGPNILGLYNRKAHLPMTFAGFPPDDDPAGDSGGLAIVTQSGAMGTGLSQACARRGLTIDYFINTGNEAGYQVADLLRYFSLRPSESPQTILLYLEGVRDGIRIAESVSALTSAGICVVALCVGLTSAGAAAARSHTGAIASGVNVTRDVLKDCGAVVVTSDSELLDVAVAVSRVAKVPGDRVAVITPSGGLGVVAGDNLEYAGFSVKPFSDELRSRVAAELPDFASSNNPVDITTYLNNSEEVKRRLVNVIGNSKEVDSVILVTAGGGTTGSLLVTRDYESDVPFIPVSFGANPEEVRQVVIDGVPAYGTMGEAVTGLKGLRDASRGPVWPAHAMLRSDDAMRSSLKPAMTVSESIETIESWNIPVPPWKMISSTDEIDGALKLVGTPCVIKGNTSAETHKSANGLVEVGVCDAERAFAAVSRILAICPSVIFQQQIRGSMEVLLGVTTSAAFGRIGLLASGGVNADGSSERIVVPLKISREELLVRLQAGCSSTVWDRLDALHAQEDLANIATIVFDRCIENGVREMEMNPLILGPDGLVAVDCRIVD